MNTTYFVFRILRRVSDGTFIIDGTTHATENEAKHHYHTVMNTYAYGINENYDYICCSVQNDQGGELMREIDDRRPLPVQEPAAEPEEPTE